MEILKLKTRTRSGSGKSYTRKVRLQGWVPAIFYGEAKEPVSIEVDKKEFAAIVRNRKLTHLVDLGLGGASEDSIAVIREIQRHVLKDDLFFHVDFQRVDMSKKVTVDCPVELVGIPIGVKDGGGVLGSPVRSVKIECMPTDIPERLSIDVSALEVGGSIHVRDVKFPDLVIKESDDEVLAVVTLPTREEEVAPAVTDEAAAETTAAAVGADGKPVAEGAAAPEAKPGAAKEKGKEPPKEKGKA